MRPAECRIFHVVLAVNAFWSLHMSVLHILTCTYTNPNTWRDTGDAHVHGARAVKAKKAHINQLPLTHNPAAWWPCG